MEKDSGVSESANDKTYDRVLHSRSKFKPHDPLHFVDPRKFKDVSALQLDVASENLCSRQMCLCSASPSSRYDSKDEILFLLFLF